MTAPPTPLPLAELPDAPGYFTLTLEPNQGPMVVLDHPFIQRLEAAIRMIPATAMGLVLRSGSDRVFVAGADLKSIDTWPDDQLTNYLAYGTRVFGLLCELNCPTVAAISGAALGGGLELAMHCDGLVAAPLPSGKPYPIGLPEASLSICPGWGGTNLLPARIDAADAIARTATGKNMTCDEAVAAGMFDRVAASSAELVPTAVQWLKERRAKGHTRRDGSPSRWIGRPNAKAGALAGLLAARSTLPATESAAAVLRAVEVGLEEGWQAAVALERRELVRLRNTAAGKAALKAFFEKSAKK